MKKLFSLCLIILTLFLVIFTDLSIEKKVESNNEELHKTKVINDITLKEVEWLTVEKKNYIEIDYEGANIRTRYNTPEGFQRETIKEGSFADYLANKKLKNYGYKALYYNGRIKSNKNIYDSVLDYNIGNQNLHQAADAIMFLKADYLFNKGFYNDISFSFVNGFKAEYSKWMAGYRIKVRDNEASYHKCKEQICTYEDFLKYMNMIFAYCSTISLKKDLTPVRIHEMQVGDVFINSETVGHAAIVVDMAINYETGEKLFMLAQSGTPAQQTQILININDATISPWYSIDFGNELITPEWTFSSTELMRFKK
ncbi:DUF4846 domain-containing protein [Sedimentibacter sp. zth1]|uniref:DUF4846 domain-containing protein n=1 Tax=Sedimentibacter sp. zth1 TaxID=2816908 RepID=UPI001F5E88E9|nr:DUF4846 domain-containing protein [Sedimentibacter sp. zth1]